MSNNIAYYLKYRPQTLDELIGQEIVKKTISSSFQNNKLSHAYLFVGPRGTGKTSLARILAKMVNCEQSSVVSRQSLDKTSLKAESEATPKAGGAILKTDSYPCNKCSNCLSITDGSNLDLIEIDAASNRGIEDIRSLRDKIKLAPTKAEKKVYIIDEVHMLTPEAFNALLKTLEEPPSHVLFILATTESSKVPQTILSRVQRLDFRLASPGELLDALQRIVKEEKIDIDEQALKLLVKKSDGSFRDGVKLLDQVSSANKKITAKLLEETLKSTQFDDLLELIKNLSEKNVSQGLLSVTKQIEHGADVRELMLSLMDMLRNLVFIKNGLGESLVKHQFTEDKFEELVKSADTLSNKDLVRILDILQNSLEKLKFTSIPSLPLELAIVEICDGESVVIKTPVIVSEVKQSSQVKNPIQNDNTSHSGRHEVADRIFKQEDPIASLQDDKVEKSESATVLSDSPDILKIKEKWTFVLETIRPYNFSLEALLRSINITQCTESQVYMEVPYSFHQRILEAPKNRDLLEGVLSDILGRGIRISVNLGSRPERSEDIANVDLAADDEIIRAAAEIFNSDS